MRRRRSYLLYILGVAVLMTAAVLGPGPYEAAAQSTAEATFAGGCFWCMEGPFDKLEGVISTTSGYSGGHVEDPTYEQVTAGGTGHAEAVRIVYDPDRISYERLLEVYWANVDPLDGTGQFCDRGASYRPAIFTHDGQQRRLARRSRRIVSRHFDEKVQVEIEGLKNFYEAEEYHQNYYQERPLRYKFYRASCGRDARLEQLWGEQAGSSVELFDTE